MPLPVAEPPKRPVVVWNPRSGGGKAAAVHLDEQARVRGIEPIELRPGDDLVQLVRDAVANGADALAAAGGDGTQALVATIAAELDLPFACIPAGTRNHFALDLGVDRDDVVGALDAFVNGGERRVDLAEVNGRVFVNNVSLGLYAEAVQHAGYREAKLRTVLDTMPDFGGSTGSQHQLVYSAPTDAAEHVVPIVVMVSNNSYRLRKVVGSGTRPRIDDGRLGIAVLATPAGQTRPRFMQWEAPTFEVDSDGPVPAGVDGEALVLDPPLRFTIRPGALRVQDRTAAPGSVAVSCASRRTRRCVRAIAPDRSYRRSARRSAPFRASGCEHHHPVGDAIGTLRGGHTDVGHGAVAHVGGVSGAVDPRGRHLGRSRLTGGHVLGPGRPPIALGGDPGSRVAPVSSRVGQHQSLSNVVGVALGGTGQAGIDGDGSEPAPGSKLIHCCHDGVLHAGHLHDGRWWRARGGHGGDSEQPERGGHTEGTQVMLEPSQSEEWRSHEASDRTR